MEKTCSNTTKINFVNKEVVKANFIELYLRYLNDLIDGKIRF